MAETLNIAQLCPETRVLGPGKRFVIWVQGCPFRCPECVAPDWIPIENKNLVSINDLVERITAIPDLEGITLSGGEPALQAEGLATLVRRVRNVRPQLSVIAFSGFTLGQLRRKAGTDPGLREFLNELDVLIDGLYRADLNDGLGLRGSSNQRIHFLTPRYRNRKAEFEHHSREIEIHTLEKELLMVGVPAAKSLKIFQSLPQKIARHLPS
ncbi:MAG TPA: 4Fe-4S single cluster domain-containing protein [Pyrinomonadaceae bacterium]|nr:4Fe-4S single cluster domain-containing protein [Pyrinomonadaceae bacterium]